MRRLVTLVLAVAVAGVVTGVQSPTGTSAGPSGKIYWADLGTGMIRRANLDGSGLEDLVPAINPSAVALDVSGGKMYWTSYGKIQRANLDGSGVEELVTGLVEPGAIALDVGGGKMYWTSEGKIQRANLDGSSVEGAQGLVAPSGIALDVAAGKIYWTALGFDRIRISRANLDGSGGELLLESGVYCCARGGSIALDVSGAKMYWTSITDLMPRPSRIERANLDGSGVETVLSFPFFDAGMPEGIALDIPTPVGGVSVDPDLGELPVQTPDSSGGNAGVLAGVLAAVAGGAVALGSAAWYARRRLR